jgi:hypothetical protein
MKIDEEILWKSFEFASGNLDEIVMNSKPVEVWKSEKSIESTRSGIAEHSLSFRVKSTMFANAWNVCRKFENRVRVNQAVWR